MTAGTKLETLESLFARTEEDDSPCRLWTGYMQSKRVPMVAHGGQMVSVRKLIAELSGRKMPAVSGYWTNKCGCARCVLPEHIVFRTKQEQQGHMLKKVLSTPTRAALRNAKLSRSRRKLTDEQLYEILNSNETHGALAQRFNVNVNTIRRHRSGVAGAALAMNPWLQQLMFAHQGKAKEKR